MDKREQAKQIIDQLPDYKIGYILAFLKGVLFDDELEDNLICDRIVDNYLNDTDPHKHDSITIEELAARDGIQL